MGGVERTKNMLENRGTSRSRFESMVESNRWNHKMFYYGIVGSIYEKENWDKRRELTKTTSYS